MEGWRRGTLHGAIGSPHSRTARCDLRSRGSQRMPEEIVGRVLYRPRGVAVGSTVGGVVRPRAVVLLNLELMRLNAQVGLFSYLSSSDRLLLPPPD